MALGGPLFAGDHLLTGVAHEMDRDPAGGSFQRVGYLVERPAGPGIPEVIRILDHDDDNNLPIYISSDEEEEDEVVVGIVGAGGGEDVPPFSSDEEDEVEEDDQQSESDEEEDEDTDDSDDWFDWSSEDSGYESLSEDEEELEDDDIRPRSPLVQQLPPDNFWQRWREAYPPVPAGAPVPVAAPFVVPQQLTARHPPVPVQHHELPGASASQQPEESAPSTPSLSSSTKRSREDSHWEEVTAKPPKRNCEERMDNPVPSTSGHSSSATSSTTSGSSSSATSRRYWECPFGFPLWADDSDSD
ncbi:proline-, glutamic acid- and leucine-rich protein 1-like [Thunnus maccoyii]|uniref:proline-, glutamic acid- and leucine-rich protein 1-like n=1 Tax=Thunnus maccoyii TaxID=8240 RepID=UPI001C4DD4D8|nr:proline-, glutamic acid- and leucine-rich protein 1-like [Thunnus maccoyii]